MSIKAMKLALEALGWTDEWRPDGLKEQAITALRQAIEQAEQAQPVGVVCIDYFRGCKSMENVEFQLMTDLPPGSYLLYTAPPPRQPWVGLTDEEIDECYYWKDRQWTTDELIRHVEAKLKEKHT